MIKFTKREKDVFLDKSDVVIIVFPMRFCKNKRVNTIPKRYPSLTLNIVFSNNSTNNTFYYCFFGTTVYAMNLVSEKMKENTPELLRLFAEIEEIKKITK
jgi:hypothetical protein